ncbi:NAD(P)/FAD-dependent oxidoreductase [Methylobacterium radiodurans]|uniref:FAD-dependent oxidoreductase n=1 Tax=Methylobacterium radiodurans TaxID=2202828 RepID=A0A2U8VSA8_9HYPH|nr:FAD-dependent oxidoreductase [Methylobacterium radiodurans]AWN36280.1 FAD-dependent oxidoreductase [Methylobacterium radiodurans]
MSEAPGRVVIVGASLAGLSAAKALRTEGFSGSLVLAGDEPHLPYDRPPLSKQALRGLTSADTTLPQPADLDLEFRLGVPATGLDRAERTVILADGSRLAFDRCLVATGARARPWPNSAEAALDGVFTLRTRDDAERIAARLRDRPGRVVLVGGGFISFEVASVCREMDIPVTVLVRDSLPLAGAVGAPLGSFVAEVARGAGVDLRLDAAIARMQGDARGRLAGLVLEDGDRIETACLVVAIGAERNTAWLDGAGLATDRNGLRCDRFCRALGADGTPADGIFAAGDVAHWPNPHDGGALVAVEHWGNAVAQARTAARNMLAGDAAALVPHDHLPDFWSQQFGLTIKLVGLAAGSDAFAVVRGSMEERRFLAVFGKAGRTVASASVDSARWLPAYRAAILEGAPFPPLPGGVDAPARVAMQSLEEPTR